MDGRFSPFEIFTGTGGMFLCLVFVCLFSEASSIEEDIGMRVKAAVTEENLFWTSVEARGQSVVLTGAAPDHMALSRAGFVAAAVDGVSAVDNRIQVVGVGGTCQTQLDQYMAGQQVKFRTGTDEISDESLPLLKMLASVVRSCGLRVEVAGHTDSEGDSGINEKMSQRRADAVVKYIARSGVDPSRLVARGYGETQPIADNETDEGRQTNRRIEFRVLGGSV